MDLGKIIVDNSILVVPNNIKKKVLLKLNNLNSLYNIKIMNLNELVSKLTFTYSEEAIYYLMKSYNMKFEIAKVYLNNIKYIKNKKYGHKKLDELLKIKQELIDNNLLIFDTNFKYYIRGKRIIVYGYDYITKYDRKVLDTIENIEFIEKEYKNYKHNIYEFNTLEDEVDFVAAKICDLINNGVSINNIKLTGVTNDYIDTLRRIFNFYKIPINGVKESNIISSNIICTFFKYINNHLVEETLNYITTKFNMNDENNIYIYEKLIEIINRYSFVKEIDILLQIIKGELKEVKLNNKALNSIEIIDVNDNIIDDDIYVFMLGFNMGNISKVYKDEDYLSDEIKEVLDIEKSYEKNKLEKNNIINIIKSIKNLTITYKLKSDFESYIPSTLIDELSFKVIKNEKVKYTYSNIYNKIKLSKKLDDLIKYSSKDEDLDILYNSISDLNYLKYDNKFKGIDNIKFKNSLNGKLTLSYSSIDNYNRCSFRYYLNNVLKITEFEESFAQNIGTMFHDILSKAFNSNFDFDKEYENYASSLNLTSKDKFFIKKLKEELRFVIKTINKQNTFSSLDKALYENKVYINKEGTITLTFMGIIDKILYKEEDNKTYLVIIDYKTGYPHTNINNTIYGIDMQLPVYLYLSEKGLFENAEVIGFYLQKVINNEIIRDPKKSYEKQKQETIKLLGYTIDDEEKIKKFDFTYNDSGVIKSLKTSNNGFYAYSKIISKDKIDKLINIVEENINNGFNNILDAKFDINPKRIGKNLVGCEFCKYKDICYMKEEDVVNLKEYKDLEFLN